MDFSNAICSVQMHCNSASLHESSATNGSATNLNARAKLHYQSKPSSFTISCVKMSSAWLCCKSNLQTNTLLAASKKSKSHHKFIKISQITISGSKISKVHQKCNAARVKLHLLETVFQLRTPLLLHYQSQHARICRVRAHTRARIRKRTCINVCIWTEKVCNSSTLLKGKFLLRSLTNAFVFQVVDSGNARVH